jgi:hypothetical protein
VSLTAKQVDQELGMFGMSLKGLGKELVFSEYGIGGGMTGDYKTPAANPAIVAASPYWGVDGVYDSSRDPWNRGGNRDFLRRFYDLTIQYAKRGGVNYPVGVMSRSTWVWGFMGWFTGVSKGRWLGVFCVSLPCLHVKHVGCDACWVVLNTS